MDVKTIRLHQDSDGTVNLQLPADYLKALQLSGDDSVDLIPTASGFEVRKVGKEVDKKFWEPFSETLNEYERALKLIKSDDDESAK